MAVGTEFQISQIPVATISAGTKIFIRLHPAIPALGGIRRSPTIALWAYHSVTQSWHILSAGDKDYHVEEAPWCTILVVSVPGDRGARQLQGDPEGGGEMKPL
jgi:hypothetical protein